MERHPAAMHLASDVRQTNNQIDQPQFVSSERTADLLIQIAGTALTARNRDKLFGGIAACLQELTDSDFVNFSLHDPAQNCMLTHYWKRNHDSGELDGYAADECISGYVWKTQTPFVVQDVANEQRFRACLPALRKHGVRSYASVPMSTANFKYGSLGIGKGSPGGALREHTGILPRIADIVALALENQRIQSAWVAQQERLRTWVALSRDLSSTLELEKLSSIILKETRRLMNCDHVVLALLEPGGGTFRMYGVEAPPWEPFLAPGVQLAYSDAPSSQALETRKVVIQGTSEIERMSEPLSRAMRASGIESLCSVPLCSTAGPVGILNLGSAKPNAFSAEDGEFLQQVADFITAAIQNARAYREIAQLKDHLVGENRYLETEISSEKHWGEVVGESAGLRRVMENAEIVAATGSIVLITGETGTGKERIAHAIHRMSSRRERSFIKLNCAAIPTGLVESELFGHEKGAFTGAVSQKLGRLELADKGTLFLDEIGDLPLEIQPKLLRVLQDQEFERLGGTRTIRVDVRLIAATNRDLNRAVEEKEFRRDLFYRLHVFPLHMPPLRERVEDIPLLVRHFVEKSAARLGKRIEVIPDETMDLMTRWNWPGNIRELENFIERSVILSPGKVLRAPLGELRNSLVPDVSSNETLRSKERDHIIEILRQCRGLLSGPSGAAARLGLKRTTLQYKMQKLGISRLHYLS